MIKYISQINKSVSRDGLKAYDLTIQALDGRDQLARRQMMFVL